MTPKTKSIFYIFSFIFPLVNYIYFKKIKRGIILHLINVTVAILCLTVIQNSLTNPNIAEILFVIDCILVATFGFTIYDSIKLINLKQKPSIILFDDLSYNTEQNKKSKIQFELELMMLKFFFDFKYKTKEDQDKIIEENFDNELCKTLIAIQRNDPNATKQFFEDLREIFQYE